MSRTEMVHLRSIAEKQLRQTSRVVASEEAIEDILTRLDSDVRTGLGEIAAGIRELTYSITPILHDIAYSLAVQTPLLRDIRDALVRPLGTQAEELRDRGEFSYQNGWYDKAEGDLIVSAEMNYQDFIVHHLLGNIYFYHLPDLEKAALCYADAAKYARPRSSQEAVRALLQLGLVLFKLGRLQEASNAASEASILLPDGQTARYHLSRYEAQLGNTERFLELLERCAEEEPTYLVAACSDPMLDDWGGEVRELAKRLKDELLPQVECEMGKAEVLVGAGRELGEGTSELEALYHRSLGRVANSGYLDLRAAASDIGQSDTCLDGWISAERRRADELERRSWGADEYIHRWFWVALVVWVLSWLVVALFFEFLVYPGGLFGLSTYEWLKDGEWTAHWVMPPLVAVIVTSVVTVFRWMRGAAEMAERRSRLSALTALKNELARLSGEVGVP